MIIKNVKTLDGEVTHLQIPSSSDQILDVKGQLLLLPGLIDPHISLGSPDSNDWFFGIQSAVKGGITTILDIPSKRFPKENFQELEQKKIRIEEKLLKNGIPLQYFSYVEGHSNHFEELGLHKSVSIGTILVFIPEEPPLEDHQWDKIFQMAAWKDLPVVINSNNELLDPRFKENLLEKAIFYAERQSTRLYVLNVSALDQLELIREARSRSLLIYAETTPQHLFPENPFRAEFLWEALNKGEIETIGSGFHAETKSPIKISWQGNQYDALNPIFLLPQLLTAHHEGKINIEAIVRLTRVNYYDIYKLERKDENFVLIDLHQQQIVQKQDSMQTQSVTLTGWPEYVIIKGQLFKAKELSKVPSK